MKKLMMMTAMAALLGGHAMAQSTAAALAGDYPGKSYTVVKDSAEDSSKPKETTASLKAAPDGTYTLVIQGVASNKQEFGDITLNKVSFAAPGADGKQLLRFDPTVIDVTTKDGQKYNGAVGFDVKNSGVKDGIFNFLMKFRMTNTQDLYVFFEGAKAGAAAPQTPPADAVPAQPDAPQAPQGQPE